VDNIECDILLLGDYFFDQIFSGMPEFPSLGREICASELTTTGGAMFITAAALTRLGVQVGWPADFGNDYYSKFVYDLAARVGINLALCRMLDRPYRLVTTSVPFLGERAFITYADPEPPGQYEHWLSSIDRCAFQHLHLGGLLDAEALRPISEKVRALGRTISMDCQDGPYLYEPCMCRELLPLVDIFMPNAREARLLTGAPDTETAVRVLMEMVRLVVVKDGANGAWVGQNGSILHAPAVAAGPVVDTTGAGDCFNAGFLLGYVIEKQPLETCMRYGNICGGLSVTEMGGATAAPTYAELQRQLENWR
jgi:sugar/nucleoside kinase (ribokinase family)